MSEENVELLYRSIDAISRRDLEAFMALMDQDVQLFRESSRGRGTAPWA